MLKSFQRSPSVQVNCCAHPAQSRSKILRHLAAGVIGAAAVATPLPGATAATVPASPFGKQGQVVFTKPTPGLLKVGRDVWETPSITDLHTSLFVCMQTLVWSAGLSGSTAPMHRTHAQHPCMHAVCIHHARSGLAWTASPSGSSI